MEKKSADVGIQLTSTEFQDECQTRGVRLMFAAPENQEMNGQFKVIWRTLHTISHSLMVRVRVSEAYINFTLMYTADHIFPVLPIKDLTNEDGEQTPRFKLATGTKPSISHLSVLFFHVMYKNLLHMFGKRR